MVDEVFKTAVTLVDALIPRRVWVWMFVGAAILSAIYLMTVFL